MHRCVGVTALLERHSPNPRRAGAEPELNCPPALLRGSALPDADFETERLSGPEIDHQLEFHGLLHRQTAIIASAERGIRRCKQPGITGTFK
jgi:hypothetical protein